LYWLTAIVRPFKLNDVYDRLLAEGIGGMTVTEVKGRGSQPTKTEVYRGNSYSDNFIPKIKIEVALSEEALDSVIDSIIESATTGKPGDGKIFVSALEQVIRIRTGETGTDAI